MSDKKEKLARKLNRSITGIKAILELAKTNGVSIAEACAKLNKTRNYVNCGMFFLRAAEKRNKISIPEIQELENDILEIKTGRKSSPVTAVKVDKNKGTQIENAIAGMRLAVANKISMGDAGIAIGKSAGYLPVCVSTLGQMASTKSQRDEVSDLHARYLEMVQDGTIRIGKKVAKTKVKKVRGKYNTKKKKRAYKKRSLNPLSHIVGEQVEFKYPVITGRPVSKVLVTYPLDVLKPGEAFAVPAKKGEMRAAIKAVRKFARKNSKAKFLQLKEGREFVTWRTA